jgi:hypothetical protein
MATSSILPLKYEEPLHTACLPCPIHTWFEGVFGVDGNVNGWPEIDEFQAPFHT